MLLLPCYAMPGAGIQHALTRPMYPLRNVRYLLGFSHWSVLCPYAPATQCPVLTYRLQEATKQSALSPEWEYWLNTGEEDMYKPSSHSQRDVWY